MRPTPKMTTSVVGTIAVLLALAACGGSDASSNAGSSDTDANVAVDTAQGDDYVAAAQSVVQAALSADKDYPAPPGAFEPGEKSATVIAQGFAIPVIQAMAQEAVAAYKAMGWEVGPALDGELNPATFGGQVDQAVQQGVDAITLVSAPLTPIKPAIQRALDAGIAVTCVNCDIGEEMGALGVEDASVDFQEQGRILASAIIARTNGKANVVITEEPAQQTVVDRVIGLEEAFADCSGCTVQKITIPAADSVQPGPPAWTSFLATNPAGSGLTDAVAYYDGLSLTMATTLKQQGRDDVLVSGFDADETPVAGLATGDLQMAADLAIPYEYQVWSAVDLAARISADAELWDASKMPSTLLDVSNAGDYKPYVGPADDWKSMFRTSWGVK